MVHLSLGWIVRNNKSNQSYIGPISTGRGLRFCFTHGGRSLKKHASGHGAVAQLIERVVRNDEVVGLIPICSTRQAARLPAIRDRFFVSWKSGARGETRTPDRRFRKPMLCPAELPSRMMETAPSMCVGFRCASLPCACAQAGQLITCVVPFHGAFSRFRLDRGL
jgi:hypothetical protein